RALLRADRPVFRGVLADGERGGGDPPPAHGRAARARPSGAGVQRHLRPAPRDLGTGRGPPLPQRSLLFVSRCAVGGSPAARGGDRGCCTPAAGAAGSTPTCSRRASGARHTGRGSASTPVTCW